MLATVSCVIEESENGNKWENVEPSDNNYCIDHSSVLVVMCVQIV